MRTITLSTFIKLKKYLSRASIVNKLKQYDRIRCPFLIAAESDKDNGMIENVLKAFLVHLEKWGQSENEV